MNRLRTTLTAETPSTQKKRREFQIENIEIGGGLGPLKGRMWRIGLMGSGSTLENVLLVLDALHRALEAEGLACHSGIDAAKASYE